MTRGQALKGAAVRLGSATLIGAAALSISGCASLLGGGGRPPAVYDLSAPTLKRVGGTDAQILVPEPSAIKALATERIAARPTPMQYAYLPRAAWADSLPKLLQDRLIETFEKIGLRGAVGRPGQSLLIDYQLVIDIRAFEITDATAEVALAVKLLNDKTGLVQASAIIRSSQPLSGQTNDAYVESLDRAMDAAFADLTRFVLARI